MSWEDIDYKEIDELAIKKCKKTVVKTFNKVDDLSGIELDYYCAKSLGYNVDIEPHILSKQERIVENYPDGNRKKVLFLDYNFIMPYVEKYKLDINYYQNKWLVLADDKNKITHESHDKNLLDAIKKCIIKINLGDET